MKRTFPALALGMALAFFGSTALAEGEENLGTTGESGGAYSRGEGTHNRGDRAPASQRKKDKKKAKKQKKAKKMAKKSGAKKPRKQAQKHASRRAPSEDRNSNEAAAPAPESNTGGGLAIDPIDSNSGDLPAAKDSL